MKLFYIAQHTVYQIKQDIEDKVPRKII